MIRTYSDLCNYHTFEDRYDYLKIGGSVGASTFGFDRYINQSFYCSKEWKNVREFVIVRDNGCDLGILGYEIHVSLLVHHINPISADDIIHSEEIVLNPDFLITTTMQTHNAIHYGNKSLLQKPYVSRSKNDTKLW